MISLDEKQKFYSFLAAFFGGIIVIAWLAPGAFKSLALAFALAYLLDPAVDWLEHRKVPRVFSILVILVLAGGILALALSFLIPYLWSELLKEVKGRLLAGGWSTIKPLVTGLLEATSGIVGSLLAIVSLVIIPVFFFFILKDIDEIRDSFYRFVPDPIEGWVRDYLKMVDGVLSGFIRGQIMVALSLAVLYSVGLGITGIRFGVLIGVVAGLLFIIPYVGTVIGILASAMVLLVDFSGWGQVMGVVATFGIAQAIEGYVLTPRIVGNRVGLNQLETLVVILVGGEMGGLAGLIIAIPAGGLLKKTFQFLMPDKPNAIEDEGEKDERLYTAEAQDTETPFDSAQGRRRDAEEGNGNSA